MLEIIITSSILILIIAALRFILKGKISPRLQYALWMLVAIRLLIPFSLFSSPVSVMNVVPELGTTAAVVNNSNDSPEVVPVEQENDGTDIGTASALQENSGTTEGINEGINEGTAAAQKKTTGGDDASRQESAGTAANGAQQQANQQIDKIPVPAASPMTVSDILRIVWYAGIGFGGLCFLVSNITFYRRLKKRAEPVDVPGCPLRVYRAEGLLSPCLLGLLRPSIYLTPKSFNSDERLGHILAHELTHRRHLDHIWAFVRSLCMIIYWFNPLVWAAAILSKRDSELACDESTIARLGEDSRIKYGRTLIGMMAEKRSPIDLLSAATTMTGGKKSIKERITLIVEKPRTARFTLITVLLVAVIAIGCTFTGAVQSTPEPIAPEEDEASQVTVATISLEAEGDIPDIVKSWATEDDVRNEISSYISEHGYTAQDVEVTSIGQCFTESTSETKDIQLWALEYRFLPEDANITPADGVQVDDDGWLKFDYVYALADLSGKPNLYLLVVHDLETDSWDKISLINGTEMQAYDTPDMLERYQYANTAAAIELYYSWLGVERPGENNYNENWIYELFDAGSSMDVGLVLNGDKVYNTYTVNDRWYAERYEVVISSYIWSPLENDGDFSDPREDAPYYITVASADGGSSFTFFADSDMALYSNGGAAAWYRVTYKSGRAEFMGWEIYSLATQMRDEYDNLNASYENIIFTFDSTPQDTVRYFTELYGDHLLSLPTGGNSSITDYQVIDWSVSEVSEDESAILGGFEYAVMPENYNSSGLWAGNTYEGTGEYEGWLVMSREFVLQKQSDGYWHCIDMGTGGASLPDSEPQSGEDMSETVPADQSTTVADVSETVHIEPATDELLAQYASYHEYTQDENGALIMISTDTEIKDFDFFSVYRDPDDLTKLHKEDALVSVETVTPDKPFVVKLMFLGDAGATFAISFTDANGIERHFILREDGRGPDEAPPYFLLEADYDAANNVYVER